MNMGSPADRTANRVVDVQTFLSTGQSLRELEGYAQSLGRSLSDVERRLLTLLPGLISQFDKAEQEMRDFGKVSSDTIKTLKANMQGKKGVPYALNLLAQFNPKTGLSKNERNDTSFIKFAGILEDILEKMGKSFEHAYAEWEKMYENIDKVKSISPQPNIPPSPSEPNFSPYTPSPKAHSFGSPLSGTEYLNALLRQMYLRTPLTSNVGTVSLGVSDRTTGMKDPLENKIWGHFAKQLDDIKKGQEEQKSWVNPNPFKYELSDKLGFGTNVFKGLKQAFNKVPIFGSLASGGYQIMQGASGMNAAGKALLPLAGMNKTLRGISKFMTGTGGALLGAIAAGVGLFVAQLKKSSPVLQAVFDIFELAWNLLFMPLGNALGELLLPMAEYLINFAIAFNELFSDFSLEKLGEVMYSYMQLIWGSVISIVTALPSMFVNSILEKASDLFRAMGFSGIADGIDDYRRIWNTVLDTIKNLPMRIWEYIKDAWANIADFFKDPIGKLSNLAGTIGTAFANAIKNAGSSVGDWVSNLLPFAKGGIVTGPTPALVGEAGPEAIIPLDKAGGLGATYVININGDVYGVSDLESRIERVIQRTASRSFYR